MKFIFPKLNLHQEQNYSVNFKILKEKNLAWHSRRLTSRKLVQPMWEGPTSNKETCADTPSIPPSQASLFTQRTIPTNEGKWKVVRHYDQDERQSDASMHWGTIRPVLLKAFAKHGAPDFSEKYWLRLIHEGSSNTKKSSTVRIPTIPWLTFE